MYDGYMLARVGKDRRRHAFKRFTTQEPRTSMPSSIEYVFSRSQLRVLIFSRFLSAVVDAYFNCVILTWPPAFS